ncbi:MAG TPA: hypothetical protein PLN21_21920, partial [Gemmatales bacterium]|nr:hypothetical protein [Gemmatales bacterium]
RGEYVMENSVPGIQPVATVLRAVVFVLSVVCAAVLFREALNIKKRGARLSPVLWGILGFLFSVLAVGVYFALRALVWQQEMQAYEEKLKEGPNEPAAVSSKPRLSPPSPYPVTHKKYKPPVIRQLIGEICLRCGNPISSKREAGICTGCGCGVHDNCAQACDPVPDDARCPICGGNPQMRVQHDYAG